jgi:hypothetical protein
VQAGTGTDQIGRFDIVVDDDTNAIVDWKWQLIPIDEHIAEPDLRMAEFIDSFKTVVDRKYSVIITKLGERLTHPRREEETSLGNLLADTIAEDCTGADVVLLGAGSVRVEELGPAVTLMDFLSCFPYDDVLTRYTVSGAALRKAFGHWMRPENRDGEGECYQVNAAVRATYSNPDRRLVSLEVNGRAVEDQEIYGLILQGYHAKNAKAYLDLDPADLTEQGPGRVAATSAQTVLREWLPARQNDSRRVEGRLVYVDCLSLRRRAPVERVEEVVQAGLEKELQGRERLLQIEALGFQRSLERQTVHHGHHQRHEAQVAVAVLGPDPVAKAEPLDVHLVVPLIQQRHPRSQPLVAYDVGKQVEEHQKPFGIAGQGGSGPRCTAAGAPRRPCP